MALRLF